MTARPLERYEEYTREDVHDIFAPETPFTPQTGTWGLHGFVRIPEREGDFVFFVTFGQSQGEHVFDEGVTESGILTWQSQPRQALDNPVIQQFIAHNELKHSIYLFLRTKRDRAYAYLGKLKYLSHDKDRERPVYFQWQILDWQIDQATLSNIGLKLGPDSGTPSETEQRPIVVLLPELTETQAPAGRSKRRGVTTKIFRTRKSPDYETRDARNRKLGLAGEEQVIAHERKTLQGKGRPDLAEKVRHVAVLEGDGAGYDVLSYTPEGEPKYIEVKTTRGGPETGFYLTSTELAFSKQSAHFYLYRLYHFDIEERRGEFYILTGALDTHFELEPLQYRALR
jgi:hypothetical protein